MLVKDGQKIGLNSLGKNMPLIWIYFRAFPFWETEHHATRHYGSKIFW